jgi:DNA-binding transcriptional ArsR family regulator
MKQTDIASLLFGAYRREVLALLLLHPEQSLHVREIARVTGKVPGTLLRELNQLAYAGILLRRPIGNQVHFQADPACPIYDELRSILKKTSGLADVLRQALEPLGGKVKAAFVYGSMARGGPGFGTRARGAATRDQPERLSHGGVQRKTRRVRALSSARDRRPQDLPCGRRG